MKKNNCINITAKEVKELLPEIPQNANKYTRGKLLLVAGSYGMAGACVMAAKAALKSGVGYLNIACPKEIYDLLAVQVPEAVYTIYDPEVGALTTRVIKSALRQCDACVVGPGLGTLRSLVCPIVQQFCEKPLLVDADGLNWVAEQGVVEWNSNDVVYTPHTGEMSRLCNEDSEKIETNREEYALRYAGEKNLILLLKGPETLISHYHGGLYENTTGCAGMAKAGSGDVLSGIIGGLMAQGMDGFHSAICGAWIHGKAGELSADEMGIRSMGPMDMIMKISTVLKELEKME